jgi:putative protease
MKMKKTNKNKLELLAPAGDFPSMVAAIESGTDAVYFGIKDFNMRAAAGNFSISDLNKINKLCEKKVKKYLTLNIVLYDNEMDRVEKIVKSAKGKVDAIICWDLSVIALCKKYKIPFHVSTQASISNSLAAKFYKDLGAQRIVLARELNLEQIKEISKVMKVECFIHGAMCVSISGRCFTSQFLSNKSANRGECTQYCRRAYIVKDDEGHELKLENNRVMSAKDLCTLPFIRKLKSSGVTSFKIEGRNRSPEYVKTVVSVYRKALDNDLTEKEIGEGIEELKKVYNRGFSPGFYLGLPTNDDFSRSEDGEAKEKKLFVGEILKYWPKVSVAAVKIRAMKLSIGDEIYVIGKETGAVRTRIESMEDHNTPITSGEKGQTVGIKIPKCKKGDSVYIIVKTDSKLL